MDAIIHAIITLSAGVLLGAGLNMGDAGILYGFTKWIYWYMLAYILYWFIYALHTIQL